MSEAKVIWTPSGMIGARLERVELTPGLIEWLAQFDLFAQKFGLGLHCSKCHADLVGKNHENAKVFSAACGCREFIGHNRDFNPLKWDGSVQ